MRILRLPDVLRARGRSRSSHYLDIKNGVFTRPIKVGMRAVGWPDNEVNQLNSAAVAGKSTEELRQLVLDLEKERKRVNSLGVQK